MHPRIRLWDKCVRLLCGATCLLMLIGSDILLAASETSQNLNTTISLSQAVDLALNNNLQTLLAEERIAEARGEKGIALSTLLPNLSGSASQMSLTTNLAAMGLSAETFPGIPAFIGPHDRFDARIQLVQTIFNLASIRRYQAGKHAVALAGHSQQLAVQQVTAEASLGYLAVLEAGQAVEAAQANVQLAERLRDLARSQREAGIATGIDVVRAETKLANQQVQLAQAQTGLDTARLTLLRVIGEPLNSQLALADSMRFTQEPLPDPERALQDALANRADLKVIREQARIAETQRKAAVASWAPSVSLFGDYGSSGLKLNEVNYPTRSFGVQVDVPLFNGGRTRSEKKVASSRLRQAEMQLNDLQAVIEKDVRLALDNLGTRAVQVTAAQQALELAERELELAQDRFRNGVTDNIEVVNAQTALENARLSFVSNMAQFNIARLNLAVAIGHAEDFSL